MLFIKHAHRPLTQKYTHLPWFDLGGLFGTLIREASPRTYFTPLQFWGDNVFRIWTKHFEHGSFYHSGQMFDLCVGLLIVTTN